MPAGRTSPAASAAASIELKHSRDISITGVADWRDVEQRLNLAVLTGLQQYLRTYPFSLIAPLMLQQPDAEGTCAACATTTSRPWTMPP